jgi:hypothetical protein
MQIEWVKTHDQDSTEFEDSEASSVNAFKRIRNMLTACSETDEVEARLALPDCAPRLCATGDTDGPI